jgi:hypothetical protein
MSEQAAIAYPVKIDAPVGRRWGKIEQRNRLRDQETLLAAFGALSAEAFDGVELLGAGRSEQPKDGVCQPFLLGLIKSFQAKQKLGTDQVVDPAGGIIRRLNQLLKEGPPNSQPRPQPVPKPSGIPPSGQRFKKASAVAQPGTCLISNVQDSTISIGPGAGGFFALEVTDPVGKVAEYIGIGGGVGASLDPSKLLKAFQVDGIAKALADSLKLTPFGRVAGPLAVKVISEALTSMGFSFADWLALMGVQLAKTPSATTGILFHPLPVLRPAKQIQVDFLNSLFVLMKKNTGLSFRPDLNGLLLPTIRFSTLEDLPGTGPHDDGKNAGFFSVLSAAAGVVGSGQIGVVGMSRTGVGVPDAIGVFGAVSVPILKLGAGATAQSFFVLEAVRKQRKPS